MKMTCLSMKEKICPRIMRIGSLVRIPKITQEKSLRLFASFDKLKALGRVGDKGGFQENKKWRNCW
jgi:hypothetical protein